MAAEQRLHAGGLRLLSDAEPDREGGLQFQRFSESAGLPGRLSFASGMEGHSKASWTLGRFRVSASNPMQQFP
jgi:hypothetical protein